MGGFWIFFVKIKFYMKTFSIIKPEVFHKSDEILKMIDEKGFKITGMAQCILDKDRVRKFYDNLKDYPWFEDYIQYMSSDPVSLLIIEGENAVEEFRKLVGETDPANAKEGTIRKLYGKPGPQEMGFLLNAIHAADSNESAEREINFFSQELECAPR